MGTVGVQVKAFQLPLCTDEEGESEVYNTNQFQQDQLPETSDLDDSNLIQTKVFKRRRKARAVLDGDPKRGLPPKCCDRCKSDLNGRLMVRCSTCSFRCHLYCFSPPLKQHPAFLIRHQQQNLQADHTDSEPIWKCEKCDGISVVFNVQPRSRSLAVGSPKRKRLENSPPKRKKDSQPLANAAKINSVSVMTSSTEVNNATNSGLIQPVQPQWIENSSVVFDWYRFRTEKAGVLCQELDRYQTRNGVDKLVFYSKTYALMKKTAAIWRAHVLRRRQFRHKQEFETKAIQYPQLRLNVMGERKPTDKITIMREEYVDEEDIGLVETNYYVRYSRRRPRLPLLWKGEAPSALMCWTTAERVELADVLAEIEERVCIASEDFNAPLFHETENVVDISTEADDELVENSSELDEMKIKIMNIGAAARIIQTIFARHRLQCRRIIRANRQRRTLEEAQRRAKAHLSVTILRTCIQFIVTLMRKLGQARTKKTMLLVLQDAAEESRIQNEVLPKDENIIEVAKPLTPERIKQLAEVRIGRFFVRRVHPYVKLKKNVMTRRIQRWWKRKNYLHKWRESAIAIRQANRIQACTKIQRYFRYVRVRGRFRELAEKHKFRKLRRVLTRWWFLHLAKKEEKRRAVYDAAEQITTEDSTLSENASIDEILEQRGMELYRQSDFSNSASLLERLYEMRKGNMSRELLLALAYSHHMTWYTSYDHFNLSRAHELYCSTFQLKAKGEKVTRVDPLMLQDLAIVTMHMGYFGDSLRLLAKLIEYFARAHQFPLWLLLAAVQLQERGEWEQSVEYLTYLHDIPPSPYLERDILALAAMGYERISCAATKTSETRTSNALLASEAWRAALRQWSLEKVADASPSSASIRSNGRSLTLQQKWELLTNLGQRALDQGHYLLAIRVYKYALERNEYGDQKQAWWNLADAFRHLGFLDLYVKAALRSDPNSANDVELQNNWRERADKQACSFQTELKTLTVLEKLRQLSATTK